MSNDKTTFYPCTPEEFFLPRPDLDNEISVDALMGVLTRAHSVLLLLWADGDTPAQEFTVNHRAVIAALYCAGGLIEQAITMVEYETASPGEVEK